MTAAGRVRLGVLDLTGAAAADHGGITIEQVNADLSGASRATLGPRESANLDMSGSSRVTMLTTPRTMVSDMSGSAAIENANAAPTTASAPAATAAKTK